MPIIGNVVRHDERRTIHLEFISGDHDEPMVLVHREVLYDIYHHANSELHHEVGGYLIGFPAIDHRTGVKVTYIEKAIRAIYNSSQTHVTMHPTVSIKLKIFASMMVQFSWDGIILTPIWVSFSLALIEKTLRAIIRKSTRFQLWLILARHLRRTSKMIRHG